MDAARYFIKIQSDPLFYLLSEWPPISLTPDPEAQLCTINLLLPLPQQMLFTTHKPICANACNTQVQGNVFQSLREAFSSRRSGSDFALSLSDDQSSAQLEVRLSINSARTSFLSLLKTDLERVYLDDPLGNFFTNVERLSSFMTVSITQEEVSLRDRRIAAFSRLETHLQDARKDVQRLREETGVSLAARLLTLYNSLKQKLKELANDGRSGAGPEPKTKAVKAEEDI